MTNTLVTTTNPESNPTVDLRKLSPEQYDKWRLTGDVPPEAVETAPEPQGDNKPPEANKPPEHQNRSEKRTAELRSDIEGLAEQIAELGGDANKFLEDATKSEKVHDLLRIRAIARDQATKLKEAKNPTAPPAAKKDEPPAPKAEEKKAKPKREDFPNADDYVEALAEWKADERIAVKEAEREKQTQEARINEARKQQETSWKKRVDAATKKHSDFKEVALSDDLVKQIPPNSAIDAAILHRENGAELLYYFGQNPEELTRLLELNPVDVMFELAAIERSLSADAPPPPKKDSEPEDREEKPRDDSGKFVSKKITDAPPPPPEVGGRASASKDELTEAVERGDFAAFKRLEDAKGLKAQKG